MQRFGDRTHDKDENLQEESREPGTRHEVSPRGVNEPPYRRVSVEQPEADTLEQDLPW